MPSPADDTTDGDRPDPPDPAISYPRGNRLGLRHPRPTVVVLLALAVLVGGALVVSRLAAAGDPEYTCTVDLDTPDAPIADDPDAAFLAFVAQPGREGFADFEQTEPLHWDRRLDEESLLRVVVAGVPEGGSRVVGIHRCTTYRDPWP